MMTDTKPATLSPVQKRKLFELYRNLHREGTDQDVMQRLDQLFVETFGVGINAATYEQGARINATLLAQLREPRAEPPVPPAAEPPAPSGPTVTAAPSAEKPVPVSFSEAPYSCNFRLVSPRGVTKQYSVRAMTEDGIITRGDSLEEKFLARGYQPAEQPRPATAPTAREDAKAEELTCPDCGSDVWDNRRDRKPGDRRPLLKCKECEWRKWPAKKSK